MDTFAKLPLGFISFPIAFLLPYIPQQIKVYLMGQGGMIISAHILFRVCFYDTRDWKFNTPFNKYFFSISHYLK
jgi:hypothetical protein